MGYFTRSKARRANSQPAETEAAPAKPRKLQKKNPRQRRETPSLPINAPVIEPAPAAQPIPSAGEEPAEARAPENEPAKTMKPIGQYPSTTEYKSAGLTPPPKNATKRAKLVARTDDDAGDDPITDTPITPGAEEEIVSDAVRVDDDDDEPMNGIENPVGLEGPVEGVIGEDVVGDVLSTNLATPISEAVETQTAIPSLSPIETPADTPADETMTDPVLTVPDTHLTVPDAKVPSHQSPATAVADGMAPESEKAVSRNFIAVLNSLPVPLSDIYDVDQLKRVLEIAISNSYNMGDDDVALSLVYYWSGISGDEFKLSLIHNVGCKDSDHNLELALRTMLRHSVDDATKWYKVYSTEHARTLTRQSSASSLSSAKSLEAEPLGQTSFKVADIYRDTSGPKLEEAFVSGKTNTAPLKRPKKPCPVNEKAFKRHREWEADPTLEETVREKRTRFAEEVSAGADEGMVQSSAIRPQRGQPDDIEQPYTLGQQSVEQRRHSLAAEGTAADEAHATSFEASARPGSQRIIGEWRKTREHDKQRQKKKGRYVGPTRGSGTTGNRARSLSVDSVRSHESDLSNSCYSLRINGWNAGWAYRPMPTQIEPPENSDNCHECDEGGNLLCCDTCDKAFHFGCVHPAVDPKNPPKGEWHCESCLVRNSVTISMKGKKHDKKTEFNLDKEYKEYFSGVGEGVQYNAAHPTDLLNQRYYMTVPHLPRLTKPPKHPVATPAYDDPNLLKLTENGQTIRCNRCGKTSEGVRPIIRCDYCPSRFHLDCLDPPRANPPNPYVGWMCPNHVRPDEMIVSKMVDGHVQERRVRRPKTCITVDIDVLTTDDSEETSFDDDWREKRARLPAGDIVMDFVNAVRQKNSRREREYFKSVASTAISVAKQLTKEHLDNIGVPSEGAAAVPTQLAQNITSAIENMRTGDVTNGQYDAAAALLGLAQAAPAPMVGENPAAVSSENIASGSQPDEAPAQDSSHNVTTTSQAGETATTDASQHVALGSQTNEPTGQASSQNVTTASQAGEEIAPATIPTTEADSRPEEATALASRHTSRSRTRRTSATPKASSRTRSKSQSALSDGDIPPQPRASCSKEATPIKKKRSRAESEASSSEDNEPAQKRQHTDSD